MNRESGEQDRFQKGDRVVTLVEITGQFELLKGDFIGGEDITGHGQVAVMFEKVGLQWVDPHSLDRP